MHNDYGMMEAPTMLPFDSRASTSAPLQRPIMAPQYMVPTSYSSGPMNSLNAPHYQQPNPYPFGGYHHGPPTPPHQSMYKPEYQDRRALGQQNEDGRVVVFSRDQKHHSFVEQAPSPARSDSQVSNRSVLTNPTLTSKTITSNDTINPEHRVNFETDVDELMKAIQRRADEKKQKMSPDTLQQPLTPGMSPTPEAGSDHACQGTPAPSESKNPRKRYTCTGPNCNKSFTQKTHLDIHKRTHTGDKPYTCDFDGCNLTFSQLGNLKTHMRRHTGERPYECGQCGRRFAQRGNVRAHEQTHMGLKPYMCRLDDCNKAFSQLGNMKTHQNNFHKKTLKDLTTRFAHVLASGKDVPEQDRELFEYFALHYKNSNKGIKGRGKARTVAERKPKVSAQSPTTAPVTTQYPLPQVPEHIPAPPPQQSGASHPGSLAAYSMSRGHPNMMNNMSRDHHTGGYEMFEMANEHPVQGNTNMIYEEDHSREPSFNERMY